MTATITSKVCRRCKVDTPARNLKRDWRYGDGYSSFCKACHQAASVEWQRNNRERMNETRRARRARKPKEQLREENRKAYERDKARGGQMWRLYRMTPQAYESLLVKQGGTCALCDATPESQTRRFAIDHDHSCCPTTPTCGECTRGILCGSCNLALHRLASHPDWVRRLVTYLKLEQRNG